MRVAQLFKVNIDATFGSSMCDAFEGRKNTSATQRNGNKVGEEVV